MVMSAARCPVQENFDQIAPRAVVFGADFYDRLFDRAPDLRAMFPHEMAPQVLKLIQTLSTLIASLSEPDTMRPQLLRLGAIHADLGTVPDHYPVLKDVLLDTLREWLGETFTPEAEAAWIQTIDHVASVMLEGAAQSAATQPRHASA